MKLPSKRFVLVSVLASFLVGVALAAHEINKLHGMMNAAQKVAEAVAAGLGSGDTPTLTKSTVSISLCFGLISLGHVDNPDFVIAVGDVILGTLITGFAIALMHMLFTAFRRSVPAVTT